MAILAGAALAAWLAPPLPDSLSGLRTPGPAALRLAAAVGARGAWRGLPPVAVGWPASLAAFFIACEWAGSGGPFAIFFTAAGAALLVAVLHESHRMAFRDGLTSLPNRRALEEQLRALG